MALHLVWVHSMLYKQYLHQGCIKVYVSQYSSPDSITFPLQFSRGYTAPDKHQQQDISLLQVFADIFIDWIGLHNDHLIFMDQLEQDVARHHRSLVAST